MTGIPDGRALILYDGLCGFCNGTVRWLIKRDRRDRFRFAPQQSALAERVLTDQGVDREEMLDANSVYLVLNLGSVRERLLVRSDATIEALRLLGGLWGFAGRLLKLIPRFIRDYVYRLIARNRLRLAGRYEVCPLPNPAERMKFVG